MDNEITPQFKRKTKAESSVSLQNHKSQAINDFMTADCLSMVGMIQANHLLPILNGMLKDPIVSDKDKLTIEIKLFDYYSCTRQFEFCDFIAATIKSNSQISLIKSPILKAEYWVSLAYQHRNYKPTENFALSETYFEKAEALMLEDKSNSPNVNGWLYAAMVSRFWLYANYIQDVQKANELDENIEALIVNNPPKERGYLLAFRYFQGCFYLQDGQHNLAEKSLAAAETLSTLWTENTRWFFERLQAPIKEKLTELRTLGQKTKRMKP